MFWIKIAKNLINLLHSQVSPTEIAAGAALGSLLGCAPVTTLHGCAILVLIFILNVNIGSAFFAAGIVALAGFLIDPIGDRIGYALLVHAQGLTPFWTHLYNMPVVPFTRFNNTVVLGDLVIGLCLVLPVFFAARMFIVNYRRSWQPIVEKWRIVKFFKASSAYNLYDRLKGEQ